MYAKTEYPVIAEEAINISLHFSTTYLRKLGFTALTNIKNKKRDRLLSIDQKMCVCVCLSSIRPRIELLCTNDKLECLTNNLVLKILFCCCIYQK